MMEMKMTRNRKNENLKNGNWKKRKIRIPWKDKSWATSTYSAIKCLLPLTKLKKETDTSCPQQNFQNRNFIFSRCGKGESEMENL